jgi:Protein of unknown function (DUF3300)
MKMNLCQARTFSAFRGHLALLCVFLLVSNSPAAYAQAPQAETPQAEAPKIPKDQLDSLVAPIALYPDPLLAQMLAASTYPLEIIQLQQWLAQHKDLKDKALADAVQKEDWDPSVQGLAALPDAVDYGSGQRLSGATERRDGRGAAHAHEGSGCGDLEIH